ncbi:MAG: hypothetical protein ABW167_12420, partial [Baekduia sp.]
MPRSLEATIVPSAARPPPFAMPRPELDGRRSGDARSPAGRRVSYSRPRASGCAQLVPNNQRSYSAGVQPHRATSNATDP